MNRQQGRTLLSLYAVDVFLDAYKDRLPITTSTGTRERFAQALAELEMHVQTQSGAPLIAEGLTRTKDAKREALVRDHLAPIARIARLESASYPGLTPLKLPRGEPGTAKLLAHAAGMAAVARDNRDVFVAAGMRLTFVEDLNDAIDDILATLTARTEKHGARSGATKGVKSALAACNKYKAVLDSFIQRDAHADPELLGHWRTVKRVERLPTTRRDRSADVGIVPGQAVLAEAAPPIRDSRRLLAPPQPTDNLTTDSGMNPRVTLAPPDPVMARV